MRLTILQYGGDYREAWERFEAGGKATYQAQRYSVDFVGSLAQRLEGVTIICMMSEDAYDVLLPNEVRAIGLALKDGFDPRVVIPVLAQTAPDRLALMTPMLPAIKWANLHRVRTLAILADSFPAGRLPRRLKQRYLGYHLNRKTVDWVANHGIASCLSLVDIGVRADKIVPWDWPPSHTPFDYEPRTLDRSKTFSVAYVGTVAESKGVGDLLHAAQMLKGEAIELNISIIGRDHNGEMEELSKQLGLADAVRFVGVVPNEDVPRAMRSSDAIVIPSRHDYPEGLPLTIYEALAARTPIIASDHPMFRAALAHEQNALIFAAKNPEALASNIRRLMSQPELYLRLSTESERAWQALQLPVKWGDLLGRWLNDELEDRQWIWRHRLSSGLYLDQIDANRGKRPAVVEPRS